MFGIIVNIDKILFEQDWNLIGPFEIIIPVSGITTLSSDIIASAFFGCETGTL
jgi:hypothetical protein